MSPSWSLPGPAPGASGVSSQERADQLAKLFGRDIWFDVSSGDGADYIVTKAGDWALVEGREALRQSVIRRIITNPGEWQTLPEYGAGARLFVKARNTEAARAELTERIRGQLLRDRRIAKVDQVIIERTPDTLRIAVVITPRGEALRAKPLTASVEVS